MDMIGKLDQRITFYEVVKTSDGQGGYDTTNSAITTLWAEVDENPRSYNYENNRIRHIKDIKIRIRRNFDILSTYLVEFRSELYTIETIYSSDDKNTYIKAYK